MVIKMFHLKCFFIFIQTITFLSFHSTFQPIQVFAEPASELTSNSAEADSTPMAEPTDDSLLDYILGLVIPSDDFWSEHYDILNAKLQDRLPYDVYLDTIDSLKLLASSNDAANVQLEDFTFSVVGVEVVLPWSSSIEVFADTIRPWIRGFFMLLLAYYNYRQILFLIRGTTYSPIGSVKSSKKE